MAPETLIHHLLIAIVQCHAIIAELTHSEPLNHVENIPEEITLDADTTFYESLYGEAAMFPDHELVRELSEALQTLELYMEMCQWQVVEMDPDSDQKIDDDSDYDTEGLYGEDTDGDSEKYGD